MILIRKFYLKIDHAHDLKLGCVLRGIWSPSSPYLHPQLLIHLLIHKVCTAAAAYCLSKLPSFAHCLCVRIYGLNKKMLHSFTLYASNNKEALWVLFVLLNVLFSCAAPVTFHVYPQTDFPHATIWQQSVTETQLLYSLSG